MPVVDYHNLISLVFLHMLAVASPGPDFMIVVKQSIQNGRKSGILTSIGIGSGLLIHCIFALTVLTSILHFFPEFLIVLKIVSVSYLLFMAYGCFRSKPATDQVNEQSSVGKSFWIGFFTNITNPKVIIYITVIFANIANQYPIAILVGFSTYISLQTIAWFILVSYLFCHAKTRQIYLTFQRKIDITMGLLLIFISIRILFTSL